LTAASSAYNVVGRLGIVASVQNTASAWLFKESAENYKAQPEGFVAELGNTVLQSTVSTAVFSTVVGSVAVGGVAMASTSVLAGAAVTSAGLFVIEKSFGKWASDYTSAGLQYGSAGIVLEVATKTADHGAAVQNNAENIEAFKALNGGQPELKAVGAIRSKLDHKAAMQNNAANVKAIKELNGEQYELKSVGSVAKGRELQELDAKIARDVDTEQEVFKALDFFNADVAKDQMKYDNDVAELAANNAEAKEFLGAMAGFSDEVAKNMQELAAPRAERVAENLAAKTEAMLVEVVRMNQAQKALKECFQDVDSNHLTINTQ
jgi:hypothetical protein